MPHDPKTQTQTEINRTYEDLYALRMAARAALLAMQPLKTVDAERRLGGTIAAAMDTARATLRAAITEIEASEANYHAAGARFDPATPARAAAKERPA